MEKKTGIDLKAEKIRKALNEYGDVKITSIKDANNSLFEELRLYVKTSQKTKKYVEIDIWPKEIYITNGPNGGRVSYYIENSKYTEEEQVNHCVTNTVKHLELKKHANL